MLNVLYDFKQFAGIFMMMIDDLIGKSNKKRDIVQQRLFFISLFPLLVVWLCFKFVDFVFTLNFSAITRVNK